MSLNKNLKYCIIIPVHNEEKYIGKALNSVVNQRYLPEELIVVNDNSTDGTQEILSKFQKDFSFIKVISSNSKSTEHQPGAKIISAFYKGFEHLKSDWDIIVKLDSDVILPHNYFEKVIETFASNSSIGIVGGLAMIEENGKWTYEKIGNKKQVRGPFKSYSKKCFEKIGGLKKSIGWDTVDELLARYYGFEVCVLPELEVKLQKPTGKDYKEIHGLKTGQAFYRMDYGFTISLIAALKASYKKKSLALFYDISKAYIQSVSISDTKIVTKEEGKFIRKYRWKQIFKRFFLSK